MDEGQVFEHAQSPFYLFHFALALGLTHCLAGFAASPFRTKSFLLTGIFPIRTEIRSTFGQSQANTQRPAGCSITWGLLSARKFTTTGQPGRQIIGACKRTFKGWRFFVLSESTERERAKKNSRPHHTMRNAHRPPRTDNYECLWYSLVQVIIKLMLTMLKSNDFRFSFFHIKKISAPPAPCTLFFQFSL